MTDQRDPNELLMIEASARQALHMDHASHRPLSEGYELIGLIGEAEFARVFNQPLGWEKGEVLVRTPVRDFGKGILNHYIARENLRPIADLLKRVMRLV